MNSATIQPGGAPLIQTTVRRRRLEMWLITNQELRQLRGGYSSPALTFLGLCLGAFCSLSIAVCVGGLTDTIKRYFVDAMQLSALLTLLFGWLAARDWCNARNIISELQRETVDIDALQKP
jgi:hypothetical protein